MSRTLVRILIVLPAVLSFCGSRAWSVEPDDSIRRAYTEYWRARWQGNLEGIRAVTVGGEAAYRTLSAEVEAEQASAELVRAAVGAGFIEPIPSAPSTRPASQAAGGAAGGPGRGADTRPATRPATAPTAEESERLQEAGTKSLLKGSKARSFGDHAILELTNGMEVPFSLIGGRWKMDLSRVFGNRGEIWQKDPYEFKIPSLGFAAASDRELARWIREGRIRTREEFDREKVRRDAEFFKVLNRRDNQGDRGATPRRPGPDTGPARP